MDVAYLSSWLNPLFWLGFKRTLEQTDLYTYPQEADSEQLLRKFNRYLYTLISPYHGITW